MKMKDRTAQLKETLGKIPTVERIKESRELPDFDGTNRQGYGAYASSDELRFISMLNTLKLEPQFYRNENEILEELQFLIETLAMNDPYFVAQCIVYSRCLGEGMRAVNHLAAAMLAPFASQTEWGKRFYSLWNKKEKHGGCIFRPDDMNEIKCVYNTLNEPKKLTNAMKKGFASAIENMDSYSLLKYKKSIIDISNLSHPNVEKSSATVTVDGVEEKTLTAIMKGMKVSADTWEVAHTEAGKVVSEAVKAGKISEEKAEEILKEAKNDNWESLLKDKKLGILAALRNLRNMLQEPRKEIINMVCELITNKELILNGKIMPYQFDIAREVVLAEHDSDIYSRQILSALDNGLMTALPNLKEILEGRNCVIVDCSGSMHWHKINGARRYGKNSYCIYKAGLIAAMLAKSVDADIILFGDNAKIYNYSLDESVFNLADDIRKYDLGYTNLASAFELIKYKKREYDRIFILSDMECNRGIQVKAYAELIREVNSPYIYSIDMAAYGSHPLKNNDKVNYYYGFGYSMFEDIAHKEFNPKLHIGKIRAVVI